MSTIFKWAIATCICTIFAITCIQYYAHTNTTSPLQSLEKFSLSKTKKTPGIRARFAEERARHEFDLVKDPKTGKIPEQVQLRSKKQAGIAPILDPRQKGTGFTVTGRGPNNLGGRTRALAFDVSDPTNNTLLAGGVSSGVFRTTNGGGTWTKVSANDEIHNVTAIVQDPRAGFQNIWYYGTGEDIGNSTSQTGSFYKGHGIWKSTDSGLTWTRLANFNTGTLEDFDACADFVYKLAVDPVNGDVYAAITGFIRKSTDGGTTWASVFGGTNCTFADGETDIAVTSTGRVYIGVAGDIAGGLDGVWTSPSGNAGTFTQLAGNGTPTGWNTSGNYDRLVIAVAPSNEDIVYALYENGEDNDCDNGNPRIEADFFKYDAAGGGTWTDLSANLPDEAGCSDGNDPFSVQGGYDLSIVVKPDDANTVFVGGTNVYRSTDGFASTGNTTRIGGYDNASNYALYLDHHPDIHTLVFAPGGSGSFDEDDMLFTGTDGGIHRGDITAATVAWTSLNNDYVTYQYYYVAIDPSNGSQAVVGGAQDNGSTLANTGNTHSEILGGDGVAVGIATNGDVFAGVQNGRIFRLNGASGEISPNGVNSIFVTYFLLDPDNTELLYFVGEQTLYRTQSSSTVESNTWETMTGVPAALSDNIRSLAVSRGNGYTASDANRKLYMGTADGEVWRLDDPGFTATTTAPVDITPAAAGGGIVSSIAVHPTDDKEIIVTYSSYNTTSVFHTANADAAVPTWTEIEGNISLASFRSSAIVEAAANTYYIVGTSVGLYCTQILNGGSTTWTRIGANDIGFAVVSDLAYRVSDNMILAGTHGNGMFMIEAPSTLPVALENFTATPIKKQIRLDWQTSFELNHDRFEIERSATGRVFEPLDRIQSQNASSGARYVYYDTAPLLNRNVYRLKLMDRDGQFTYSPLVEANFSPDLGLEIYPNPFQDRFSVSFYQSGDHLYTFRMFDLSGRKVYEDEWAFTDAYKEEIQLKGLGKGAYIYQLQTQDKFLTGKLIRY